MTKQLTLTLTHPEAATLMTIVIEAYRTAIQCDLDALARELSTAGDKLCEAINQLNDEAKKAKQG